MAARVAARMRTQSSESPVKRQFELGQAIARMYIAAQHTDHNASDAVCQAMENATLACKMGFDSIMKTSPYNVTSLGNQG